MSEQQQNEYRFKYLEEKISVQEERIKGLEILSNEFTKIATILEMQTEMNRKQDETLTKINDNLTTLNHTTKQLGERVNDLESEVKEVNSRDTVSIGVLMRKVGWTVLTLAIGAGFTWLFKDKG